MKISRRNALIAGSAIGLDAILEGFGLGLIGNSVKLADYTRRRASYHTPQQVAEIFKEQGVNPVVTESTGNRTLLIVGDSSHLVFGKTYVDLVTNVKGKVNLSRVFMEGIYEKSYGGDSHLEYFRDQGAFDEEDYITRDQQGYFRLKKSNVMNGIENRELCLDVNIIDRIGDEFLKFMFTDKLDVFKVNKLYDSLKNKCFVLGNLSQMNIEEKRNLQEKISKESDRLFVLTRNSVFVSAINRQLKDYETGALVIGEGHISLDRHPARPLHLGNYNFLSDLSAAGIGSVYLSVGDAVMYNLRVGK